MWKSIGRCVILILTVGAVSSTILAASAQTPAPAGTNPPTPTPASAPPKPATPAANLRKFPPATMWDATVQLTLANVEAELKPEGKQREAFAAAFRDYEQAITAWEKEHAERYTKLCVQLERAAQYLDVTRMQQAVDDLAELARQRVMVIGEHRYKILSLMNETQKIRWLTYKVRMGSLNKLRVVKLTPAQEQRIGELARAVIEEQRRDPRFFETSSDLTLQFVNVVVFEAKRKVLDEKQKLILDPPAPESAPTAPPKP